MNIKINQNTTDDAILNELGGRFTRVRLERNLTQAQLAEQAGVAKRTVERLENGEVGVRLWGFLRICRALGLVERLDALLPEMAMPGPIEQFKFRHKMRKRATGSRGQHKAPKLLRYEPLTVTSVTSLREDPPRVWQWGDEQ
ncbi:MAG: helix-turn-helix domain-containing protein [Verrucomicrobiales bacterium]|jgi:transcriptional regulator with XRE-family HTH domain|nr:helix-turn-helix domain-containing protein [Verrucomicrobiales bacterium]